MHSQHSRRELIGASIISKTHWSGCDGDTSEFDKVTKLITRAQATTANIKDRIARLGGKVNELVE